MAQFRGAFLVLTIILLLLLAFQTTAHVAPVQDMANPGSSDTERWIWEKAAAGERADLHVHCNNVKLDPKDAKDIRWNDPCRAVSGRFVERVLSQKEWHDALPHRGLQIFGARFEDALDLTAAQIGVEVELSEIRFKKLVLLDRARFAGMLSLAGSVFEAGISAQETHVEGSIFLNDAVVRGERVDLSGASLRANLELTGATLDAGIRADDLVLAHNLYLDQAVINGGPLQLQNSSIGGELVLSGSKFEEGVFANQLRINGNLLMTGGASVKGETQLRAAVVGGLLNMSNSTFRGNIIMAKSHIGGGLFLHNINLLGERLNLFEAEINGGIGMIGATLESEVSADGLKVEGKVSLNNSRFKKRLTLHTSNIQGGFDMVNSKFESGVILTWARVSNDLVMGGSSFATGIVAHNIQIGGHLYVDQKSVVQGGVLDLRSGAIQGNLYLSDSTFEGVVLARTRIGAGLVLDKVVLRGGPLEIAEAEIKGSIGMAGATIDAEISGHGLEIGGNISLSGAKFKKLVTLYASNLRGSVDMANSTFEAGVMLYRNNIAGDLVLRGSSFGAGIQANSIQIGGRLVAQGNTAVSGGTLELTSSTIRGNIEFMNSTFEGIVLERSRIGGSFFLDEVTIPIGGLDMLGAQLNGDVQMFGTSAFQVNGENISVEGNVFLDRAEFGTPPNFGYSQIKGVFELNGSKLPGLILDATVIGSELRIGRDSPPTWGEGASLLLNNARANVLSDLQDSQENNKCAIGNAWPRALELQGFIYERLGGNGSSRRQVCWYRGWLARDLHFSHQPYRQLATVLRSQGEPGRANAVLHASRDRELEDAWREGKYFQAGGLMLLKGTIGYGIGSAAFRVLYWVAGFTILGAIVLWFSADARKKGAIWCLAASLNQLVPLVQLNKEFTDYFNDPQRTRLAGWQLAYFACHAIVGYLLGSFVIVALTGLTKVE